MAIRLLEGDTLLALRTLADASVDSVVTSPPARDHRELVHDLLQRWIEHSGDERDPVPPPALWREVLRVLKPGGHVLCAAAVRDQDLLGVSLRIAGFEIRDCIRFEQGGAGLPAWAPVVLARKPLEGTAAQNVMRYGTGALNIDGCRVEHVTVDGGSLATNPHLRTHINGGNGGNIIAHEEHRRVVTPHAVGRYPANVVHDGSEEVEEAFASFGSRASCNSPSSATPSGAIFRSHRAQGPIYPGEEGSASRFFYCARSAEAQPEGGEAMPDTVAAANAEGRFPAKVIHDGIDEVMDAFAAFGERATCAPHQIGMGREANHSNGIYGAKASKITTAYGDTDTAARFFHCAESPQAGRNGGNFASGRLAVLLAYLCRLVTPPGGTVLDPCAGWGGTGQAAIAEGFHAVLIERDHACCDAIRDRLALPAARPGTPD